MSKSPFCEACTTASSEESAGGFREGMFGREFRGHKDYCAECGSYVTTLWQLFLYFPLKPIGTYRYKFDKTKLGGFSFYSRGLPLDGEQVRTTRLTGILGALAIFAIVGAIIYWKSR